MYDLVIQGGVVFDGTGAPPTITDVCIKDGRITALGHFDASSAQHVIEAHGAMVLPGFVDLHTHYDLALGWDGLSEHLLRQGITTVVGGNCGLGEATVGAVLQRAADARLGVHFGMLAPLGPISVELKESVGNAFDDGALGLSWGPYHANTEMGAEQIREALAIAARRGKIVSIHRRSEGPGCLEATQETIALGKTTGVRLQISHLKVAGPPNWPHLESILHCLEEARRDMDLAVDVYPFDASLTYLSALVPDALKKGGTIHQTLSRIDGVQAALKGVESNFEQRSAPEDIVLLEPSCREVPAGLTLLEATELMGWASPAEAVLYLIREDPNGTGGWAVYRGMMSSEQVDRILDLPYAAIASDALPDKTGLGMCSHPRCYSTFARALKRVEDRGPEVLAEVVHRCTRFPAQRMSLDRGRLESGAHADIVVLRDLRDRATYVEPARYPDGIEHVIVGGQVALSEGEPTGVRAGEVLRG